MQHFLFFLFCARYIIFKILSQITTKGKRLLKKIFLYFTTVLLSEDKNEGVFCSLENLLIFVQNNNLADIPLITSRTK